MVRNPRPKPRSEYPHNVTKLCYKKPDWLDAWIDRNRPFHAAAMIAQCDPSTIGKIRNRNKYVNADILDRIAMDAGEPLPDELYYAGGDGGYRRVTNADEI